ncbi:MAG: hypothetical protein RSJ40_09640, partial [Acetivibrio sp.]
VFLIWFVTSFLHRLDVPIHSSSTFSSFYIELRDIKSVRYVITTLKADDIHVSDLELVQGNEISKSPIGATLTLHTKYKTSHDDLCLLLETIEGIEFVEEL